MGLKKTYKQVSLFQLDANLIEGEPYNRLAEKKTTNKQRNPENLGNRFQKPAKANGICVCPVRSSQTHRFFCAPHLPVKKQKLHSLTLNTNYIFS